MAVYVRDGKPKTIDEAIGLADDFVVNRGWMHEVSTETDWSTNQGKQHKG